MFHGTWHYLKDAPGRLEYDKKLIEQLDAKTRDVLRDMCTHDPRTKIKLIYKRVFCDFK